MLIYHAIERAGATPPWVSPQSISQLRLIQESHLLFSSSSSGLDLDCREHRLHSRPPSRVLHLRRPLVRQILRAKFLQAIGNAQGRTQT